jgi:hypothetical protein
MLKHHALKMCPLALLIAPVAMAQLGVIPGRLAGTWQSSEVRGLCFTDRATGASSRPSGASITYRISPGGSYKEDTLMQTSAYNCTDIVFAPESGRVRVEGSRIVFTSSGGNLNSQDNCSPASTTARNSNRKSASLLVGNCVAVNPAVSFVWPTKRTASPTGVRSNAAGHPLGASGVVNTALTITPNTSRNLFLRTRYSIT